MTDLTKAELNTLVESLTIRSAQLVQETSDQAEEIERLQRSCDHKDRQTANVSRVFVTLYEEKRTMDLRFGWLEEAARDVATACEIHLPEMVGKLAEELGLEITEDQNSDGNT